MKIQITQSALKSAVGRVKSATANNKLMPVLRSVLLRAEARGLTLQGTDTNWALTQWAPVIETEEEGACLVPAKRLYEIVSKLPAWHTLTLSACENTLVIDDDCVTMRIPCEHPVDAFPNAPTAGDPIACMGANAFKRMVEATAFAAASDPSRPILTCAWMHFSGSDAHCVTADGFRLAIWGNETVAQEQTGHLVKAAPLPAIARLVSESVVVETTDTHVIFKIDDGLVATVAKGDGVFPAYTCIVPQLSTTRAEMLPDSILEHLAVLAPFTRECAQTLRMEFNPNGILFLRVKTNEDGEAEARAGMRIQGEGTTIAINAEYLAEALRASGGAAVIIELDGPNNPIKITAGDVTYVQMPMNINR